MDARQDANETGRRSRRLERVNPGRFHGGVCQGLADYTGYDVGLFRLGAIALVILGGAGLTLYLAAWLLLPARGAEQSIAERVWHARQRKPKRVYAAALLAVLLVACSPHAVAVGALLVAAFLLWRADHDPAGAAAR
jgi:phage shock protein PspC (stress-responsive transcriptional regulator)